jgi:hypothetical protein
LFSWYFAKYSINNMFFKNAPLPTEKKLGLLSAKRLKRMGS